MNNSYEASHDRPVAIPDPHFNRLVGLSNLSQAALESVIEVLQAKERIDPETLPDSTDIDPEKLLTHYIQNPKDKAT
jgi:hypothetical protein